METTIKIATSIFLLFGIFWTLLPWSFGVHNFKKSHGKFLTLTARTSWLALLLAHPLLIYFFWFEDVEILRPLISIIIAHVGFAVLFGRDLGVR